MHRRKPPDRFGMWRSGGNFLSMCPQCAPFVMEAGHRACLGDNTVNWTWFQHVDSNSVWWLVQKPNLDYFPSFLLSKKCNTKQTLKNMWMTNKKKTGGQLQGLTIWRTSEQCLRNEKWIRCQRSDDTETRFLEWMTIFIEKRKITLLLS